MDGQSLLILVIAGVVIATFAILNGLPKRQLSRLKVRPKPLMTPAERRVCLMIERAMPGARVHSQVSMGAIMNPAKGLSKSEWWTTFNKFSSKRVDFVVEDPHSGRIILLVEAAAQTDRVEEGLQRLESFRCRERRRDLLAGPAARSCGVLQHGRRVPTVRIWCKSDNIYRAYARFFYSKGTLLDR